MDQPSGPGGHISESTQLLIALRFAAERHADQRRKDQAQTPYINHPIAVAATLAEVGGVTDSVPLMGALLHDTIEDTDTTYEELVERFGRDVADVVQEMSDDKSLPKEERKRLQIEHAHTLSHGARLVKLGDKICNVTDVTDNPARSWSVERRREYLDWAEAVVNQIRGTNAALEHWFDEAIRQGRKKLSGA